MSEFPQRTGLTDLSQAELLLFDSMFSCWVSAHLLPDAVYAFHMNCSYSHGLSDTQLDETLQRLIEQQLIQQRDGEDWPHSFLALTPAGGTLWEAERKPDWSRYVASQFRCSTKRQTVVASQEEIASQYLHAIIASRVIAATGVIRAKHLRQCQLLPWRIFDHVAVVSVLAVDNTSAIADWKTYESSRNWWGNIRELDTLNRKSR